MSGTMLFFILIAMAAIFLLSLKKIMVRRKIRSIIKKHPNTISYLKRGVFKKHELLKSLKGKVYDELSGTKLRINGQHLDSMIDKEILKVLSGWKGRLSRTFGVIGGIVAILFIIAWFSPDTSSTRGGS